MDATNALARELRRETRGEVLFDLPSRGRYATDASIYQVMPVGVFVPRSPQDVGTAISLARSHGVAVLARGAGSSQCGQTVGEALVVDCSKHLRRIWEPDLAAGTVRAEAGVVLDQLNARLKRHGLWFAVDVSTGAQATLGGMAGNNSCGSRSIAYGNMVHNVVGIDAWLADGTEASFGPISQAAGRSARIGDFVRDLARAHGDEIRARWPRALRRVGGYNLDIFDCRSERPYTGDGSVNLAHLLVGSEGTLAFTRSLTLKLTELPRAKVLGVVNFPKFRDAMQAAQHIVGLEPTAVELVDRTMIELSLANPAFRATIASALIGTPEAILLVEFSGLDPAQLTHRLSRLQEMMGELGLADSVVRLADEAAQKSIWEVRKAGLNIMMSLKGDGKPVSFIEDCAVPLEHLADYTDALSQVFARHGTRGTWYAHASVGTLHVRPILDMRAGGAQKMRSIAEEASALVRKYQGAYSGEHGDGLCRGEWIAWQFGPAINEAFRAIKRELDPANLFSPGRIVDPPKMDDGSLFRFAPAQSVKPYRRIALVTALDWNAWNVRVDPVTEKSQAPGTGGDPTGGFAMAVEMCNNNGHCRKFDAGTMCPSYRVTRDEKHLTRGRANTLRLALSGQLGSDALGGDAVREAMDLCVSCKGCRRECPTGVDMARMKIEFLAQDRKRRADSVLGRLLAGIPDHAHALGGLAWLVRVRNHLPAALRRLLDVPGLSHRRKLPAWRAKHFWRRSGALGLCGPEALLAAAAAGKPCAVLFVDTFNGLFEVENALAAARLLLRTGYTVHAVEKSHGHHCCGRTYLSAGRVDEAREKLRALVEYLHPLARAGAAVVGLEPACLLTLRDEALVMNLGEAAEVVASQAMLLEEFLARESAAGRFAPRLRALPGRLLVHGHCHQKAFAAVEPLMQLLRQIPQASPELIESSCCGMAGGFGYEASHYEVSMQMAEVSLLPAIRNAPEATLVADGTSCRQQIGHGTGREALHVARLLEQLME
jgi:FAD/FMN-containing dehydrogenase/Fe-S oxidoreductase